MTHLAEHPIMGRLQWRAAGLSDLFVLLDLADQTGHVLNPSWIRQRLGTDPVGETHLVAAIEDLPIAAAYLYLLRPPPVGPLTRARLAALVVDEDHRGLGVGSALLARCEDAARVMGAQILEMLLPTCNQSSSGFWDRHGYARPLPGCHIKSLTAGQNPVEAPAGGVRG